MKKFSEFLESKNWIKKVDKKIEKNKTSGVCSGDRFGSESCPEGSKRYNLAKVFKNMSRKNK